MSPKSTSATTKHVRKHHSLLFFVEITKLSYKTLFLVWAGLAIFFAFSYFFLETFIPSHAPTQLDNLPVLYRFLNALYYSIITATSTGYGDITPVGFSKALASMQSIASLFVFAVFVTKLVSQRQDLALQEVHKLTYEDIFHNTRGDLFTVRKDLDAIIEEAKVHNKLSEDTWETLMIAYQQAQSLISEIPEFYDGGNAFYTIDSKREQLLLESVHRTLHRINKTLDVMSKCNINWAEHEPSMNELNELMKVIDYVTPLWQQRSPYNMNEAFEDIIRMKGQTRNWVEKALPL
ncbi:potassium channel family protein [Patescibacteria group bacterium]|nr:potassium channel family protein [Patescibacteria group bacterium]MBU1124289.1 potassium channel family protein [Patescibacteria group bacterium]MBU1911535.1 potassium channel family protein [Patescibacteria group bacterium]